MLPLVAVRRHACRWALALWAVLVLGSPAWAQVTVNQILFPSNIGRTLDATVTIDYTRTSGAAATIDTTIPSQLAVGPPVPAAPCAVVAVGPATVVRCTVPLGVAGDAGSLSFAVRGAALGVFSLTAVATGGSSASNPGTVRSSGELSISKQKSPAGDLLVGQSTRFTLQAQLAAGADELPAGASLTVTDQLPGTATDFTLTAVAAGPYSCNSVAAANASRTLSCTIAGPRTAAEVNAASIALDGTPGTTGSFSNVASTAADQVLYFDRDPSNNIATVGYTVQPASDVSPTGSAFVATPVALGSAQSLTLALRNHGPSALPAGGTVTTTIPAGFSVSSLPAGCGGPATGVVLAAPAVLSCSAGALAVGATQSFAIALVMPVASASGSFAVVAAPPAGFGDAVPGNNSVNLPYEVVPPYADLRLAKSKSPGSGPVAPGSPVTTTLTVTNDAASTSAAAFSASGGGTELRVIDYLRPTEIAGDLLAAVSPGWSCSVGDFADPADPARSKRVECVRIAAGSLSPGASLAVSFTTTVGAVVGQQTLANRACGGETLLTLLGLAPTQGPQPPGSGQTANDCAIAGSELIATDVVSGAAAVAIVKESSIDNAVFVDPAAAAPTLAADAPTQFWRVTITTPAGGAQQTIPTLRLADTLPGILNVASPGPPAPGYLTPAITVNTAVTAGSATGSCPNLAAGAAALNCSFGSVAPGTTIVVSWAVARPFASGTLTNTATLSSPDAILSGTLADSAAIVALPRTDVAATTKTVTPAAPRVGQTVQFTITAQNLGPDEVSGVGAFKIVDDLNTSIAGAAVAIADITASGATMSCVLAAAALADEAPLAAGHLRVRCTNTTDVARYSTRTVTITARVLKPAALPPAGTVYAAQSNTARVDIPDALCEFKTETVSGPAVSAACNDAASTSNNQRSVSFDVPVPVIDLQQRKSRVLPPGQAAFAMGQPLRYRLRVQNNGPSRAEGVTVTDRLTVPPGFTLSAPVVSNVNAAAPEASYVLDAAKAASVGCSQAAPNADLVCRLSAVAADNFLDAGREVNFEIELTQTGNAASPVTFGNQALVCADESAAYESPVGQACNRATPNNNNVAAVNDTIFPRTDLALAKTTLTASPVAINQPVRWRLVARNLGPNTTPRIRVVDTLPPNFELLTVGPQAPTIALGSFVTAAPSSATGATVNCAAVPAAITAPGQQQTVTCDIDALPGPLGSGAFPGSADAANTLTLELAARAKEGFFSGPYAADRVNSASVQPGVDGSGTPTSIDLVAGNNSASSVVQVQPASVAGRVYIDRNGNGVQDGSLPAQDEGIGNVTITLSGTDLFGNPVNRSGSTVDAVGATRGDYRFDHLPPGSYTITQTQPAGYDNSEGAPSGASHGGSYAARPTPATSAWSGLVLAAGQSALGYDFPETLPPAGIGGLVWVDRNGNGVVDPGEPLLATVTVALYPPATVCPGGGALPAGALRTTTSGADGSWLFSALAPGAGYVVCQQQPEGYGDRPPVPGTAAASPRVNQIDIAALPLTGSHGNHFPEQLGRIGGKVFADFNAATPASRNNGVQDAGEPGIGSALPGAGVPLTLTSVASAGPRVGLPIAPVSVTTAADGSWVFEDLFPGSYTVTEGPIPPALGAFDDGLNSAGPVTVGSAGAPGAAGDNTIRNIVLGAGGAQSSGNLFAELPRLTISGVVYVDRNRDGVLGPGDPTRIAGVTVELRQGGSSCANAVLIGATVSAADGSFSFPGGSVSAAQLVPGLGYRICQLQPAGWLDGAVTPGNASASPRPNEIVIASLPADGTTGHRFGELGASLAGSVYRDYDSGIAAQDNNGRRDAAEVGIRDVPVSLFDEAGGARLALVTTDAAGRYRFDDLPAGSYRIVEGAIPASSGIYVNGRSAAGLIGGLSAGSPGVDLIEGIALPPGGVGSGFDFGELPTPVEQQLAIIGGRVYVDRNRDGTMGADEQGGIAGVVIRLVDGSSCSGSEIGRLQTGAFGEFEFPGGNVAASRVLPGRSYSLCQVQPEGWGDGATNPGNHAISPAANHIVITSLPATGSRDNRFGEQGARIEGRVFLDRDDDGRFDGADVGIPVVGITLSGERLAVPRETTTGADGRFAFDDLPQGRYTLTEQRRQPNVSLAGVSIATLDGKTTAGTGGGSATAAGTLPSEISGIALPTAGAAVDNRFAEILPARVSGVVWRDDDNDGVQQPGEPGLAGVELQLRGTDDLGRPVSATTTTGADGRWSFESLRPGVYSVTQPSQPPGTGNGITVAGSTGGTATPPAVLPSVISGIALARGADSTGNNFAERALRSSISGRVWLDLDDDGVVDPGEPGLEGVTIELSGTGAAGAPLTRITRTDAQGRYRFDDLDAGVYALREPQQPEGSFDGRTVPGSAGGVATPVGTLPSAITLIVLRLGQDATDNNFGERRPASLSGRVWNDRDNDGRIGSGEIGIAGVAITLAGTDVDGRPVNRSTTSGADGSYRFDQLLPGRYTITEPQQPPATLDGRTVPGSTGGTGSAVGSLPSTISGIELAAGRDSTDNNFGELPVSAIVGRVWLDGDRDGRIGDGETGIAGVAVTLQGSDDQGRRVERSTTTGAGGSYRFDDLRPGVYTLTEPDQPAGTRDGRTVPGSTGGTASTIGNLPSTIASLVLPAGTVSGGNDFGELPLGSDLVVAKRALEARFTVGRAARYSISVRNIGDAATSGNYTVTDRLPAGLTLAAAPVANGWSCGGAAGAVRFSCTSSLLLAPGAAHPATIEVTVQVGAAAAAASPAVNAVMVEGGGEPAVRAPTAADRDALTGGDPTRLPPCATESTANACRVVTDVQLAAALSGTVWLESGPRDRVLDAGDRRLPQWQVELIDPAGARVVATTTTGADGRYRFTDLEPGVPYRVRFRDPSTGVVYGYPVNGETGTPAASCNPEARPSSCVDRRGDPQIAVVLAPGEELTQQSLPVDPSGVVYDSMSREPVAGAVVTLAPQGACPGWNPASQVAGAGQGGYTVQGTAISMTTGRDGWYQFFLLPGAPARCIFTIGVAPPASHRFVSTLIPPDANPLRPVGPVGTVVRVQPQVLPPTGEVGPATTYHLALEVGSATPDVVHNHIPLDPALPAALALRKTVDRALAEVGDTVRYAIAVRVLAGAGARQVTVLDRLPAGFTYVAGSAGVDGRRIADPAGAPGPQLAFQLGAVPAAGTVTLHYRVRIGVGAAQGDGVNTAIAYGCGALQSCLRPGTREPLAQATATNEDRARVRVVGGVFDSRACIAGKVFVDCNGNQVQDAEELGIPGVRLWLAGGTALVSDVEGKYALCGLPPRSQVLRIDGATLPIGSRLVTSSSRNLGDAGSLWLDLKVGELHRADFVEGSCSAPVLDQVKARRAQGEVRAPETERPGRPALRFEGRAPGLPTDRATDAAPRPRRSDRNPSAPEAGDAPR